MNYAPLELLKPIKFKQVKKILLPRLNEEDHKFYTTVFLRYTKNSLTINLVIYRRTYLL